MIWRRIGQTTSLTATMTGLAMWLFVIATWIWESLSLHWPDDDFLWFLLPAGAAVGLALWLRYRRSVWIHVAGALAILGIVLSTVLILSQETPQGMEGLGIAIGKAIAVAVALISAGVGAFSLLVAVAVVLVLSRRELGRKR